MIPVSSNEGLYPPADRFFAASAVATATSQKRRSAPGQVSNWNRDHCGRHRPAGRKAGIRPELPVPPFNPIRAAGLNCGSSASIGGSIGV